jgi:HEAT repeat protein
MIGDESALPALAASLGSTFTRAEAAAGLARFGQKSIPWLLPLLTGSPDDNVRYHVKETLALVGWRGKSPKSC